ncbi:RNA polymerase sigma factor [Aureibaculum luteum]|uniref:RNA polymerase sigma factor n=1 Tax=Aureibaculum luteum TaxID=1548456 RepID=UPI0029371DDC|nr:RNA polymerase sigma factor [Aureibaculum luteum]
MKSYVYMTEITDQECILKILDGDTQKYAVLVNRYKNFVYTLVLRMVKNKEDAEEVSQDTFIKAYKSLHKFKGESKFSTWIYSIAYHTCLDNLKKTKRKQKTITINEYTEHQIKSLDNVLDTMEREEKKLAIQNCMQLLPSEDSFLLTLYYFEDLTIDEIAKIVHLKSNNIKVKLFRSRKKLTSVLKERLSPETIEHYAYRRK